jgi:hypothetical protein
MTANELADELERMIPALPLKALIKSATMLRQQQAEIEALKSGTIPYKDLHQVVKNVLAGGTPDSELAEHKRIIREQQAELDAFKLNYYNTGYSLQLRDKDETIKQQQAEIERLKKELALQRLSDIDQSIERELTDDEIIELFANHKFSEDGIVKFSKAILKKASDK